MTGRELFLEHLKAMKEAGIHQRTIQWTFSDSWDAKGNKLCVWCGKALPRGKKNMRWCSQKCVEQYQVLGGKMGQIRDKLRIATREICQGCGTDLKAMSHILREDLEAMTQPDISPPQAVNIWARWRMWLGKKLFLIWEGAISTILLGPAREKSFARLQMRQILGALQRRSLWQADHIVAVEDGGSGTDISNFQLLCSCCHLAKTNKAKAEKAEKRKLKQESPPPAP